METKYIRDPAGRTMGWIKEQPSGDKEAFDRCGRLVGRYRKHTDITQDSAGRLLAMGDWLAATIKM